MKHLLCPKTLVRCWKAGFQHLTNGSNDLETTHTGDKSIMTCYFSSKGQLDI